jgi:NAD(P)H-flavin reductase
MPLTFLVRPRNGITKKLMKIAQAENAQSLPLKTLIDGPYGGIDVEVYRSYENVILVAGGTGISAILPLLVSLSGKVGTEGSVLEYLKLVWVVKNKHTISWVQGKLKEAFKAAPEGFMIIDYYVTSENGSNDVASSGNNDVEAVAQGIITEEETMRIYNKNHGFEPRNFGRPIFSEVIPSSLKRQRTYVVGKSHPDY